MASLRLFTLVLLLAARSADSGRAPAQWDPRSSRAEVEFIALAQPGNLKIRGKLPEDARGAANWRFRLTGRELTASARLKLDGLDTGIELRNRHLREKYFETARYPTASLVLARTRLPPGAESPDFEAEGIPLTGKLTLHGVSRPLDGTLALKRAGSDFSVELTLRVRLKDFHIPAPSFLGVTVEDEVQVTARLQGFAPKP